MAPYTQLYLLLILLLLIFCSCSQQRFAFRKTIPFKQEKEASAIVSRKEIITDSTTKPSSLALAHPKIHEAEEPVVACEAIIAVSASSNNVLIPFKTDQLSPEESRETPQPEVSKDKHRSELILSLTSLFLALSAAGSFFFIMEDDVIYLTFFLPQLAIILSIICTTNRFRGSKFAKAARILSIICLLLLTALGVVSTIAHMGATN